MDNHWRNTQLPIRFFALDARAAAIILLFILHVRIWTLALCILAMLAFWGLERRGLTFASALRSLRCWLLGRDRPALRQRVFRHWIDYV
ncbi:MAG: IcmT/TraK family protein [Bdellovibrionales bacterium]